MGSLEVGGLLEAECNIFSPILSPLLEAGASRAAACAFVSCTSPRTLSELRLNTVASLAAKYSTLDTPRLLILRGGREEPAAVEGLELLGVCITLPEGMEGCLGVRARCK